MHMESTVCVVVCVNRDRHEQASFFRYFSGVPQFKSGYRLLLRTSETLKIRCLRLEESNFRLGGIAPITRTMPPFLRIIAEKLPKSLLFYSEVRMNESVRVYFCPGSSEEIGHFRKTGTEAMRRKPHTRRGKIQLYVADTKGHGKTQR